MSSPQVVQRAWADEIVLYLGDRFNVPVRKPLIIGGATIHHPEEMVDVLEDLLEDVGEVPWVQDVLDRRTPFATWSAVEFLGRDPTKSESAAISRAVRRLAQQRRPLIERRRRKGEKRRRLVRLTATGMARYIKLRLAGGRDT